MRLRISTPLATPIDTADVVSLRAEDASGSFGIMQGHADFLTELEVSVVSWTSASGSRHHCAIRRGLMTVTGGREIAISAREAIPGDDLAALHDTVVSRLRAAAEAERQQHSDDSRLQLAAIRTMMQHLRPETGGRGPL